MSETAGESCRYLLVEQIGAWVRWSLVGGEYFEWEWLLMSLSLEPLAPAPFGLGRVD